MGGRKTVSTCRSVPWGFHPRNLCCRDESSFRNGHKTTPKEQCAAICLMKIQHSHDLFLHFPANGCVCIFPISFPWVSENPPFSERDNCFYESTTTNHSDNSDGRGCCSSQANFRFLRPRNHPPVADSSENRPGFLQKGHFPRPRVPGEALYFIA